MHSHMPSSGAAGSDPGGGPARGSPRPGGPGIGSRRADGPTAGAARGESAGALEIRGAVPGEGGAARAIVQRAYEGYVARMGRRPAPMDDDYAARVWGGQVDLAVLAGEPVGVIVMVRGADHLLIENVAVDPVREGQGIGRALLAHAERVAADGGLGELRLYTNAAMTENLELYPRLGYVESGRRREHGFDRVFFVKPTPRSAP